MEQEMSKSTRTGWAQRAPIEHVRAEPWSFVGLALAMGLAAGILIRFKTARRALRWYLAIRRFV
jgi:ElaB/YqjD/DUF883 family membrane-anchored ribosome-binding protein